MKTLKNGPQKLLIIGPNLFFSQSSPAHSPKPKIDFIYYKYVPRRICLLICGEKMSGVIGNSLTYQQRRLPSTLSQKRTTNPKKKTNMELDLGTKADQSNLSSLRGWTSSRDPSLISLDIVNLKCWQIIYTYQYLHVNLCLSLIIYGQELGCIPSSLQTYRCLSF